MQVGLRITSGLLCFGYVGLASAAYTCSVGLVTPINFVYDNSIASPSTGVGKLEVVCTLIGIFPENVSYAISISAGVGNDFQQRTLRKGSVSLQYNLYKDVAHTSIWGNNTGGATALGDGYALVNILPVVREYSVYLKALPNQSVEAGSYVDSVFVTVEY